MLHRGGGPGDLAGRLGAALHLPGALGICMVVQLVVVEELELDLVRDREDRKVQLRAAVVEIVLDVGGDAVGALVQDREGRPVVEEPREGHPLLLPWGEVLLPVADVVQRWPDDLAVIDELKVRLLLAVEDERRHVRPLEAVEDVLVGAALLQHLCLRLRVHHQFSQIPERHEVHLREEVDLPLGGHRDRALDERPELADHAEEARLAAAVGARDQHPFAPRDREVQVLDKQRAVGPVDRDVIELQVVALHVPRRVGPSPRQGDLVLQHGRALLQARHELLQPRGEAAQLPDPVRELEEVLDRARHQLHVAPRGGEVRRDLVGLPLVHASVA
mmetsp:Transcript_76128/g.164730  ORF Transcript_76128/g.164730 Transcript_76128/m.164730 type:complete len:332 (+) Transcript_76128:185-1180(+)